MGVCEQELERLVNMFQLQPQIIEDYGALMKLFSEKIVPHIYDRVITITDHGFTAVLGIDVFNCVDSATIITQDVFEAIINNGGFLIGSF